MGRSRGQILLVAAFAMAIIFVALALILNTAIFTENLATRETADGHDAIDFHDAATEAGDILLRETNEEESTYDTLVSTYRDRIGNYSDAELSHGLNQGTLRNVSLLGTHRGTLLNQSNESSFENDRGNSTWQLVQGSTDARAGAFNVTAVDSNETLVLNATNGSATWELAINESDGRFGVSVVSPTNGSSSREYVTQSLELQPTNGSIEGETWAVLTFQEVFSDEFDLWIGNGANATGTFHITVDKGEGDINWPDYDRSSDPRETPAIYSATLQIELLRENLEYRANVTVEPEGADPR